MQGTEQIVNDLWSVLGPIILLLCGTLGPILATFLVHKVSGWINLQNADAQAAFEAKLRDALHQAVLNGLKLALMRAGIGPSSTLDAVKKVLSDQAVIGQVHDYVTDKNPDAILKLNVSSLGLDDIVLAKAPDALAAIQLAAKATSPSK